MPQHDVRQTHWLPRSPSVAAAGRVFCLPHAGCGAGLFRNWPRERAAVEFLPVELPGRETRLGEPIPATFEEMAAAVIGGLEPYLDVPFAFFGHCWSALAAYEVSAQLHGGSLPVPARLFVSSQVAPQDGPLGRMLDMTEAELSAELEASIRALGGQPHPELLSIYVDVLRTDIEVSRRYVVPEPSRLLSCPITAIGWSSDDEIRPEQMGGWQECGDTTFVVLDGGHHRFTDASPDLLDVLCNGLGVR